MWHRRRLELAQQIFSTPCSPLSHNSVLGRFGSEIMLRRKLQPICVHAALTTGRKIFTTQFFKPNGNPHSLGYASIEAGFIATALVPKYVLRFT
jgi:hypothetical protein